MSQPLHTLQSWLAASAMSPAAMGIPVRLLGAAHRTPSLSYMSCDIFCRKVEEGEPHINPTGKKKRGSGKDPAVQKDCGPCCLISALLIFCIRRHLQESPSGQEGGVRVNPPRTDPIRRGASSAAEGVGVMLGQETDVRLGDELIYSWRVCACFSSLG